MRQANHTIKGYLYQFLKTIHEILNSKTGDIVTVEGTIEDIDIISSTNTTTIQCKYHEEKTFTISSVSKPILEMLCHYAINSSLRTQVQYKLYAYFSDNEAYISEKEFIEYVKKTNSSEVLVKYYHILYEVDDASIIDIANKEKKNEQEKKALLNYYKQKKGTLKLKVDISDFWMNFKYIPGKSYDELKEYVFSDLSNVFDKETVSKLHYPNSLSLISELAILKDEKERKITKDLLIKRLTDEECLLISHWAVKALGIKQIFSEKKKQLMSEFNINTNVRAFVFSKNFLSDNLNDLQVFVRDYIKKYNKKKTLHNPPIFIFEDENREISDEVVKHLYNYQISVNNGIVGRNFVRDNFVKNTECSANFKCKIATLQDINNVDIFEDCNVDSVFIVGKIEHDFDSSCFKTEVFNIKKISYLRYLINLDNILEV